MAKDPILKIRLQIARERKPQVEGVTKRRDETEWRSQAGDPIPVQEVQRSDEDNIPEVIEDDGEEVEDRSNRARVGSYNQNDEASGGVVGRSLASEAPTGEDEAGQNGEHQEEARYGSYEPSEKEEDSDDERG